MLLVRNLNPLTVNEIFNDEGFFVFHSNTLKVERWRAKELGW